MLKITKMKEGERFVTKLGLIIELRPSITFIRASSCLSVLFLMQHD